MGVKRTSAFAEIRFRGRYWGQNGHAFLHRICPLMTQSGRNPFQHAKLSGYDPKPGDPMKRREFIALVGGVTAGWPLAARAKQEKMPTIGVLILSTPDPALFLKLLREALQKVGYIEGQNIRLEFRSAEGKASLLTEAAAELVRLKVDVIVAYQTPAVTAAKQATSEVPIVMAGAEALRTGLVASLAQPGGNITGMAGYGPELGGKNIELIREVLPSGRRVAVLANATDPFTKPYLG